MVISLIAAITENFVIGKNNDLPWHLPDDMKFFMNTTKGHHVLMGRKNYDSLPAKYKPLPQRINIIVTRQSDLKAPGCQVVNSIKDGIAVAEKNKESELFIIGGAEIFKKTLSLANRLYLTEIKTSLQGDTYFPYFDKSEWEEVQRTPHGADEKHAYAFDFVVYERKN